MTSSKGQRAWIHNPSCFTKGSPPPRERSPRMGAAIRESPRPALQVKVT